MMFQPVMCEGQIETWLSSFLNSLKSSLQFQLATAMGVEKPKPKQQATREIRSAGSRRVSLPIGSANSAKRNSKGNESH